MRKLTIPLNLHQSSVAARIIRTFVELIRTMTHKNLQNTSGQKNWKWLHICEIELLPAGFSPAFKTSYKFMFGNEPNLIYLRVF